MLSERFFPAGSATIFVFQLTVLCTPPAKAPGGLSAGMRTLLVRDPAADGYRKAACSWRDRTQSDDWIYHCLVAEQYCLAEARAWPNRLVAHPAFAP